ncbi:MAG: hypothetical protein EXR79_16780 [Myxococcales bacterium]|nr:hypothetical protein [Myxococcales bacterium]
MLTNAMLRIGRQVRRLLVKRADDDGGGDTLARRDPALAALLRNAMLGRQSAECNAEVRPLAEGAAKIKPHGRNCATSGDGYSLHANTRVGAKARAGLEKLAQYLCRLALAAARIERVDADNIRINLKNEWRGGVTAVLVTPRDLLIRALAQIPLSGRPSLRYYGCFAPNAADRKHVVPADQPGLMPPTTAAPDRRSHRTRRQDRRPDSPGRPVGREWPRCRRRPAGARGGGGTARLGPSPGLPRRRIGRWCSGALERGWTGAICQNCENPALMKWVGRRRLPFGRLAGGPEGPGAALCGGAARRWGIACLRTRPPFNWLPSGAATTSTWTTRRRPLQRRRR